MRKVLIQLLMVMAITGCVTHELVMSHALSPIASSKDLGISLSFFRARVNKGILEVWAHASLTDEDFSTSFDREIESAAILCAYLANSEQTFDSEWSTLVLELRNEYGSQWRWKNTYGVIKVTLGRVDFLALRNRNLLASAYPMYWHLELAVKAGPPDFVPYELPNHHSLPDSP